MPSNSNTPADASAYVLSRFPHLDTDVQPRVEFEAFIGGSIAHGLTLVGSDLNDADILRALLAAFSRGNRMFYSPAEIEFNKVRSVKPKPTRPQKRHGRYDPKRSPVKGPR
jgi:hypothetical protein